MNRFVYCWLAVTLCLTISCSSRICYVVRHADRPENGADRLMSPEGETRARVLTDSLRNKQIQSIFSTRFNRTRQTAQPLSEAIHVPIAEYSPDTLAAFARELKKQRNSLVVGHSDSILETVRALGGVPTAASIGLREFDRLFIVTRRKVWLRPVQVSLVESRYGASAH